MALFFEDCGMETKGFTLTTKLKRHAVFHPPVHRLAALRFERLCPPARGGVLSAEVCSVPPKDALKVYDTALPPQTPPSAGVRMARHSLRRGSQGAGGRRSVPFGSQGRTNWPTPGWAHRPSSSPSSSSRRLGLQACFVRRSILSYGSRISHHCFLLFIKAVSL